MLDKFSFVVDNDEFENIIQRKKTVHLIVNDEKAKIFAVGNQISFVVPKDEELNLEEKTQAATIDSILVFSNILEAVGTLGKENCGFKASATFEKTSDIFLSNESYESIEKYGILAIVFKIGE